MRRIACPRGTPASPCSGELTRREAPERYVCTYCGRIFDPQTVRAIERGHERIAAGVSESTEAALLPGLEPRAAAPHDGGEAVR